MTNSKFVIPILLIMTIAFVGGIMSIYWFSYHILVEPGKEIFLYFLLTILNGITILMGADSLLR